MDKELFLYKLAIFDFLLSNRSFVRYLETDYIKSLIKFFKIELKNRKKLSRTI